MNRREREAFTLVGVLAIVMIASVLAMAGWFQVTSSRRSLERIQSRRLVETWALSAIEETCAVLEDSNTDIPSEDGQVDLGKKVSWPSASSPAETRTEAAKCGVTVGAVTVVSSSWQTQRENLSDEKVLIRHLGILEFKVRVGVGMGSRVHSSDVIVRRYAAAAPTSDGKTVQLRIQGTNLMLKVVDA